MAVRAEDIQIEADYSAEISQNQQRPRRPAIARLNRDRAIPQTGRFEPSDKRCNNSAPVFHRASPFYLRVFSSSSPTFAGRRFPRRLSDPREKPFVCKTNKNRLLARVSGGVG